MEVTIEAIVSEIHRLSERRQQHWREGKGEGELGNRISALYEAKRAFLHRKEAEKHLA